MISEPELFTVHIPDYAESEVYCGECGKMFISDERGDKVQCPHCNHKTLRFAEFINEVAL